MKNMKNRKLYRVVFMSFILLLGFTLVNAQNKEGIVAYNDCGNRSNQAFLVEGENYNFDAPDRKIASEVLSCSFGPRVIYAFDNMNIHADYKMEVSFYSDQERTIQIQADGNPVCTPIILKKNEPNTVVVQLPRKAYAYGQLVLIFEALNGPNAVVSEIKLLSTNSQKLTPFDKDKKEALKSIKTFAINTNVDVETKLPVYTPIPSMVKEVYQPKIELNNNWMFSNNDHSDNWMPIQVPGEWAMQGFKVDSAQWARYKTTFSVPQSWMSNRIKIRFDGVHSEYHIYLNNQEVGYHLGGMTPYEIDITDQLKDGKNELSLKVRSESLADMLGSLTQYAAHQLGGITRKVTLFTVPDLHISDLRVVTDLDDSYKDAKLKVFLKIRNQSNNDYHNSSVRLMVEGYHDFMVQAIPLIKAGATWQGWAEMNVNQPRLWDNEHPNLYQMTVQVYCNDILYENLSKKIGFREIEIKGNQLIVNGKAIKLHGVCRHEAYPLTGRVLSPELWRKDAELYRNGNCNFIRTSHYPPAEEFIELCDELGLFVEVESPVCWIGHHANENWKVLNYRDSSYYTYVLQANMETIHFYRNHPSVIFWSMANESYWNKEFAQIGEYMKKADPTRPYAFHDQAYGGFNNQGSDAPIANIHYPGPGGYKVAAESKRPMTYGEFCHLNVYNRSELVTDPGVRSDWALALAPTWENMYKTQGVLGGSIWSGIDDIFQLPDGNAVGYGAWGVIDGWRRTKPEYWDMKKIYSPIRVLTQKIEVAHKANKNQGTDKDKSTQDAAITDISKKGNSIQSSGNSQEMIVEVENRYLFTNLSELKVKWSFGQEGGYTTLSALPGEKGLLKIKIDQPQNAQNLALNFIDPRGFEVDSYVIPVGEQIANKVEEMVKIRTKLSNDKNKYKITGKGFECNIDKATGQILSLKKEGEEVINGGPWLMALPLTGGGCYPNHNAHTPAFNEICSDWKVENISAKQVNNDVIIQVIGAYKEFKGSYSLTINANGELFVDYQFDALAEVNPRQWGLVFEAPLSYNQLFWRRKGMWNVYPNDHIGRTSGEALLKYDLVPEKVSSRTVPTWAWSYDANELGSNDFRSTRKNIWFAGLKNADHSHSIMAVSDGEQHWRSWKNEQKIRFLIANFVSPGNEMFLESYYAKYRKPIKIGDQIKGQIKLRAQ